MATPNTAPYTYNDVSVVMATYNEAAAIDTVLTDIKRHTDNQAEIIVVDSSTDATPEIAREHGATVIEQPPQGYGIAVKQAIETPDRPVIITTDCDDTYPMDAIPDFLTAINDGCDVVSGNRLAHGADAMPAVNRLGNHLFALLTSLLVGRRVRDTTTGMRAYRRTVINDIEWTENTGLSAELLIRPLLRGYTVCERPIQYKERLGDTTLNPVTGGLAIAKSIVKVSLTERFTA